MSWLFGRKKSQPQVFVAEETSDGFTRISVAQNPYGPATPTQLPPHPQQQRLPPYPPLPYDIRPPAPPQGFTPPGVCPYPPIPNYQSRPPAVATIPPSSNNVVASSSSAAWSPLESVPFKLSNSLSVARSPSMNLELDGIKNNLALIRSRIRMSYDYDFKLEKSVIREVNLSNGLCTS